MMNTNRILLLLISIALISCGSQKRIAQAKQTVQLARQNATAETQTVNSIAIKAMQKLDKGEMDTVIKQEYNNVLNKLNERLNSIETNMALVELAMNDKSNFNKTAYKQNLLKKIVLLDSFNLTVKKREYIYDLINEAIKIKAFNLFDLAAFFGAGKYKIPPDGVNKISQSFEPVIDSIAFLTNKYNNLPHTAKIVFVGYADGTPIAEGSELYQELAKYINVSSPTKEDLNKTLSDLRAKELLSNTKKVIQNNAAKFADYNKMKIRYTAYGKGEDLPFNTIKDYKEDDERRRIVLFYWCVLPDSSVL